MAQALVTVETVRDYIASRGGVVKNVELVRHFRLFLQQEDPEQKGFNTFIADREMRFELFLLYYSSGT